MTEKRSLGGQAKNDDQKSTELKSWVKKQVKLSFMNYSSSHLGFLRKTTLQAVRRKRRTQTKFRNLI